jgi:hypothetical protein
MYAQSAKPVDKELTTEWSFILLSYAAWSEMYSGEKEE